MGAGGSIEVRKMKGESSVRGGEGLPGAAATNRLDAATANVLEPDKRPGGNHQQVEELPDSLGGIEPSSAYWSLGRRGANSETDLKTVGFSFLQDRC